LSFSLILKTTAKTNVEMSSVQASILLNNPNKECRLPERNCHLLLRWILYIKKDIYYLSERRISFIM